jgi:2-keto-4-pentenoate hydratase/2-oxohepta-3-ene-1,7-dioic acid hydratase in catechol pathway
MFVMSSRRRNKGSYIEREEALKPVAGYALHNDYSQRVFQPERGAQGVKGKSADRFCAAGAVSGDMGWDCGQGAIGNVVEG